MKRFIVPLDYIELCEYSEIFNRHKNIIYILKYYILKISPIYVYIKSIEMS